MYIVSQPGSENEIPAKLLRWGEKWMNLNGEQVGFWRRKLRHTQRLPYFFQKKASKNACEWGGRLSSLAQRITRKE